MRIKLKDRNILKRLIKSKRKNAEKEKKEKIQKMYIKRKVRKSLKAFDLLP
jgi:hypothetical protein